jgi:hypothetical protein
MRPAEVAKPLGVFILVIVVVVAGTAVVSLVVESDSPSEPDSESVQGQSPGQFEPDRVNPDVDPETGELTITDEEGHKRILVDNRHDNRLSRDEIGPVVEALTEAGHEVDFGGSTGSGNFGTDDYNTTLRKYDAVVVAFPTRSFTEGERLALRKFTENDGRVVVLAEPPQTVISGAGFAATANRLTFGADDTTWNYGVRTGVEALYNMDDDATDNNFRSIDAEPVADDNLTEGVEEISFDYAGYAVINDSTDAEVLFTASDGTRKLETRRTGPFPTVVRNDTMVFVADSDFITTSELYDADNEVFVSNLMNFLVSGDKPDDVPRTPGAEGINETDF